MPQTKTRTVRRENFRAKHNKLDRAELHAAVHQVVQLIPHQRITSYSHVAKLIGMPKGGRHVREALKFIVHTTPPAPWHRVTSTAGILSTRNPIGGPNNIRSQQELLENEGVEVQQGTVGEMRVDFAKWGWFPEVIESADLMKEKNGEEEDWGA